MQATFNLRMFDPSDLNQVIEINRTCLPENYSTSFFMEMYERFPETFIVAEAYRKIVGYIMCRIERSFSGMSLRPPSIPKKGHIISVAVLPEYRNKGIGNALVQEALQSMTAKYDADYCYLEVRVNNTDAIKLYRKLGFEVGRTIRGYYSDGESAYIMVRKNV